MVTPTRPAAGAPRDESLAPEHASGAVQLCRMCKAQNSAEQNFCGACGYNLTGLVPELMLRDPLIGVVVADRYRFISKIGVGGMGVVYKAEHVRIGKLLAIKLLHGDLSRDATMIRRFNREARAVSRLASRHTAQVFDYGNSDGLFYLVMELLRGRDLGEILDEYGTLSVKRTVRILQQIAVALTEAHDKFIVHRDLKPENLFISRDGSEEIVKVLDFGLAKLRDRESLINTQRGSLLGTPYYMAPEQIDGDRDVNHLADVYSLGAVTWKILTGQPPYPGDNPFKVVNKHLQNPIPRLSEVHPRYAALDDFFFTALAKRPEERYPSVQALADAFQDAVSSIERTSRSTAPSLDAVPIPDQEDDGAPEEALSERLSESLDDDIDPLIPEFDPALDEIVSTREDFDHFETRLKLRRIATVILTPLLLVGVVGAIYWGVILGNFFDETTESEPNNSPREANPLRPGQPVTGTLGDFDDDRPDRDFYQLLDVPAEQMVRINVTPIPDLDLVLELVNQDGIVLAKQNAQGPGYGEVLTNHPVEDAMLFVAVREYWIQGTARQSRPDIFYTVTLETRDPVPGEERESNDERIKSNRLLPGNLAVGYLSSAEDADWYQLEPIDVGEYTLMARLSGLPQTDVAIDLVDSLENVLVTSDDAGLGAAERLVARVDGSTLQQPLFLIARSSRGFHTQERYQLSYEITPVDQ